MLRKFAAKGALIRRLELSLFLKIDSSSYMSFQGIVKKQLTLQHTVNSKNFLVLLFKTLCKLLLHVF